MAYIKQNFANGQVLSADHLNHIEDGIKNLETEIVLVDHTTKKQYILYVDNGKLMMKPEEV